MLGTILLVILILLLLGLHFRRTAHSRTFW